MAVSVVFETHSWSEDNERGIASGWNHSSLSVKGRQLASELGERRRLDGIDTVFSSDLGRAAETAVIAFEGSPNPVLFDWRLRECDYGQCNGIPASELHQITRQHVTEPFPAGESWTSAIDRVGWFIDDLERRFDGQRVLVIGHIATYWGFVHRVNATPVHDLVAGGFDWQLGWEFVVGQIPSRHEAERT